MKILLASLLMSMNVQAKQEMDHFKSSFEYKNQCHSSKVITRSASEAEVMSDAHWKEQLDILKKTLSSEELLEAFLKSKIKKMNAGLQLEVVSHQNSKLNEKKVCQAEYFFSARTLDKKSGDVISLGSYQVSPAYSTNQGAPEIVNTDIELAVKTLTSKLIEDLKKHESKRR